MSFSPQYFPTQSLLISLPPLFFLVLLAARVLFGVIAPQFLLYITEPTSMRLLNRENVHAVAGIQAVLKNWKIVINIIGLESGCARPQYL